MGKAAILLGSRVLRRAMSMSEIALADRQSKHFATKPNPRVFADVRRNPFSGRWIRVATARPSDDSLRGRNRLPTL